MSNHSSYRQHSPYYRAITDKYGQRVPEGVAQKLASDHGLSLGQLREQGEALKVSNGTISAIELVMALGY
jgi:hypothetical protein